MFSENRFCSLLVWDLLRLTPWVFWSEIFTRHSSLCLLSFGWDLSPRLVPQDPQEILYSSLPGLKGKFVRVWNCMIFFLGEYSCAWPEICRIFSQIKWRFLRGISGENHFVRIFQKFCENQGYLLAKLVKFRPTFCNFFPGPYCTEKVHASTFVFWLHPGKEARPQTDHRKKIRGRKARTFCFRKTGFLHSRSGIYCALLLGYFVLKFLPDIRHCFYWVLA